MTLESSRAVSGNSNRRRWRRGPTQNRFAFPLLVPLLRPKSWDVRVGDRLHGPADTELQFLESKCLARSRHRSRLFRELLAAHFPLRRRQHPFAFRTGALDPFGCTPPVASVDLDSIAR